MRLLSLRSVLRLVALVLAAGVLMPAPARAEEQPAILKAYGLDWIERVRDDAWPQPKAERPVICLLDTGVDVTPDTPANDPNGPIVDRLALDGGTGVSQGTGYPYDHGTQMAAIIAAPRNDWGTVGVFPQGRIVSIRVTDGTDTYITPEAVAQGVRACTHYTEGQHVRAAAIVMAESNYEQRPQDRSFWETAGSFATSTGAVLFAATGNDAASGSVAPFGVANLVPVVAAGAGGSLCAFSTDVDSAFQVAAPGCDNAPWPRGSSAATAVSGAFAAAIASYKPALSADELRLAVVGEEPQSRRYILSGAAQRQQLERWIVPVGTSPSQTVANVSSPGPQREVPTALWRPSVRARWLGNRLVITRRDRRGGRLFVDVTVHGSARHLNMGRSRTKRFKVAGRPRSVAAWCVSVSPGAWRSLTAHTHVV